MKKILLCFVVSLSLAASIFSQQGVAVKALEFDKEFKRWPFQVGTQKVYWDLSDSKDIAAQYALIDGLIKSNKLTAYIDQNSIGIGSSDSKPFSPLARISLIPAIDTASVQGGKFTVKSSGDEATVSDFLIAKTAVTQELYKLVTGTNPSKGQNDGADSPKRPVENVTWIDALRFCNKLSLLSGLSPVYAVVYDNSNKVSAVFQDISKNGWRLPTIAEYEFAARGGKQSKDYYFAGGNKSDLVAWTAINSGEASKPVGLKAPNELGIFDLSGNVSSWCWDPEGYPGNYVVPDYQGPWGDGFVPERAIMGGSFLDQGWNSALAVGSHVDNWRFQAGVGIWESKSKSVGIRLVRSMAASGVAKLPPLLSDISTKNRTPGDPDKILAAVQNAGTNRFELDKALKQLITATWTTDPTKVTVKSLKPGTLVSSLGLKKIPGKILEFDSGDPLFKWSGSVTFFWDDPNIDKLYQAGKLHAQIDWQIVPLSPKLFSYKIADVRLLDQAQDGSWRTLPVWTRVKPETDAERRMFAGFLSNTFELGKRDQAGKPKIFTSLRVEGNANLQSFYIAEYPITLGQYANVKGEYENGAIRRPFVYDSARYILGTEGPVGYAGNSLISPSRLFEPADGIMYVDAAAMCNALSRMDGLEEVYGIQGRVVIGDLTKNGWRLPTLEEYEWARMGGVKSKGYKVYAGTNNPKDILVNPSETEHEPWVTGLEPPNELGLYDMTGNVKTWIQDLDTTGAKNWLHRVVGLAYFEDSKMVITAEAVRSGNDGLRISLLQDSREYPGVGFRPVRPDGKPSAVKVEPKPEPKNEAKIQPKIEPKKEPKPEPTSEPKAAAKLDAKPKPTGIVQAYGLRADQVVLKFEDGAWVATTSTSTALSVDSGGRLWGINADYGLFALDNPGKIEHEMVSKITFGAKGIAYIVTMDGKIELNEGSAWKKFAAPFSCMDLSVAPDGTLWALSNQKTIHKFTGGQWTQLDGEAETLAVDSNGGVWATSKTGQIYLLSGTNVTVIPGTATRIYTGSKGEVWALGTGFNASGANIMRWTGKDWAKVEGGAVWLALP